MFNSMGILVTEGVLPSGIPISNVYMSFSGSLVYIEPKNPDDRYIVRSFCKVFKDYQSKTSLPDITFQVILQVSDINTGVYNCLYTELKQMFPNSKDLN